MLSTIYDWLELNHSSRIAPHKAAEDQTMRQLIYKLSAAAIISPSQSFIQHPQLKVAGGCPATLWFNRCEFFDVYPEECEEEGAGGSQNQRAVGEQGGRPAYVRGGGEY